jgi:outer membrane protein TolC
MKLMTHSVTITFRRCRLPLQRLAVAGLLFFLANNLQAQHVNTKPNEKAKVYIPRNAADSAAMIEERLVQLAYQGPAFKEAAQQNKINDIQLVKAKNSWLNLLTISANYNDQTFAKKSEQVGYIYPKYFFGITIPVGVIFSKNSDVKIARENADISRTKVEELQRNVRAEVLTNYEQYKIYGQLYAIQSQVVDDEQAAFLQVEQKFRNGTIPIADYNNASKNLNNEIARKLSLQLQQNLYKVQLEKYIGMRLETALSGL